MIHALNRLWLAWHMRRLARDLQTCMDEQTSLAVRIDQLIRDGADLQRRCLLADVPALNPRKTS